MFTFRIRVRSVPHFRTFKHYNGSLYHMFIVCYGYIDNHDEDLKRMNALDLRALAGEECR